MADTYPGPDDIIGKNQAPRHTGMGAAYPTPNSGFVDQGSGNVRPAPARGPLGMDSDIISRSDVANAT